MREKEYKVQIAKGRKSFEMNIFDEELAKAVTKGLRHEGWHVVLITLREVEEEVDV